VIETVIGRFKGLVDEVRRCMATDLDLAAVESANLDSRGMVVELAMLASPEFTGGDEVAVVHRVELEPTWGIRRLQAATRAPDLCKHPRFCAAADQLRGFDLSLLAGMAPPIMARVGSGRWIVRPIAQGAVAITWAHGV
jgi:hypothetical protein